MNVRLIIGTLAIVSIASPSLAQVVVDRSLQSNVTGCPTNCLITGGTAAGSNLFHSFSQFSIPTGGVAAFQPEAGISRIFSRVTGEQISQIDGELRVNGVADLFLVNPIGVQFGPNAKLSLNGSFIGTTAQTIDFGDGEKFGIGSNLLSIKVPVGLDILRTGRGISVQDNAIPLNLLGDPRFAPTLEAGKADGLAVAPGKTLAFIGQGITLNQAALVAPSGNIELHSVALGSVQITEDDRGYQFQPNNAELSHLNINQLSRLDASGLLGSQIRLTGQNISLNGGSSLLIQNLGEAIALRSLIEITANNLTIQDYIGSQSSRITSEHFGLTGADIRLNVDNLAILNGGNITTRSYGIGDSGKINIKSKSVSLNNDAFDTGTNTVFYSAIVTSGLSPFGQSSGGDLNIQTQTLNVSGGSGIYGRNIAIQARDITVQGSLPNTGQPSGIFSNTGTNGTTGQINISTSTLAILDGANVGSNTSSLDPAGDININALQAISVSGRNPNLKFTINNDDQSGIVSVAGNQLVNNLFFTNQQQDYGASGTIRLTAPLLSVDSARIITTNLGRGNAGIISLKANQAIFRQSSILSDAKSGNGGGIKTDVQDIRLLDSLVGAASSGNGIGGNIFVNANTVTSFRSLISATSFGNRGGRVQINAAGVFNDRQSSVIVTSGLGPEFSGQYFLNAANSQSLRNQPRVDSLAELPKIVKQCPNINTTSSLVNITNTTNPLQQKMLGSAGWRANLPNAPSAVATDPSIPSYQDAQGWELTSTKSGYRLRLTAEKNNALAFTTNNPHENCK